MVSCISFGAALHLLLVSPCLYCLVFFLVLHSFACHSVATAALHRPLRVSGSLRVVQSGCVGLVFGGDDAPVW